MEQINNHIGLPWYWMNGSTLLGKKTKCVLMPGDNHKLVTCRSDGLLEPLEPYNDSAKFIVIAANNFYKMRDFLIELEDRITQDMDGYYVNGDLKLDINQLLEEIDPDNS